VVELAERIKHLPPYLFAELDRKKQEARRKGVDIIDLGVGDPSPIPLLRGNDRVQTGSCNLV